VFQTLNILPARASSATIHERFSREQRDDKQKRGAATERRRNQSQDRSRADSNTEKEPDEWVSGGDPMTGAQASYLKTLSQELHEPDNFKPELTKAEASKRIDALKTTRSSARQR
jgi:Protein of unknown function (DUF3072)